MGVCGEASYILYDLQDRSDRCGDGLQFYHEETDLREEGIVNNDELLQTCYEFRLKT